MMNFPQQKELFDNQSSFQKRRFLGMGRKTLLEFSGEKTIFLFIGLFFLLVLTFCLGIERGKKIKPIQRVELAQGLGSHYEEIKEETKPSPATSSAKSSKDTSTAFLYTIQLATYKSQKYANQELKKLQGYDPRIVEQGNLWIIYAGRFKSKKEATAALKEINKKNRYKDPFVRKIPLSR